MAENNRIAAIQMVSTGQLDENLLAAEKSLIDAHNQGAGLALLPENFALMSAGGRTDVLATFSEEGQKKVHDFLSSQAHSLAMWIVAGSVPHCFPGEEKVRARCCVYSPEGKQVAFYDKIHLFDAEVGDEQGRYKESDTYIAGDQLVTVDTPLGKLGLTICFDLRFPNQYQNLRQLGADIITVPSAFTWMTGQAHWEALLRARAIENQSYIIAANQGGRHSNGRRTWGHSMIIDPWGQIKAVLPENEGVIVADIDLTKVRKVRMNIPMHEVQYPAR
jgi:nitrilase